jgi:hypothetical protein
MSLSRILNVGFSFSLTAAVLMFSTTFLLLGGCPQPAPTTNDNVNDNTNNPDTGQDTTNPDDGYQAPDTSGDSAIPDDTTPGGSTDPGDSGGGTDDPPPIVVEAGDMNGDGQIDAEDIRGFVLALMDPAAYLAAFPDGDRNMADVNGDGHVNSFDIDAFRQLIEGQ